MKYAVKLPALLTALCLTSCALNGAASPEPGAETFCQIAEPILIDAINDKLTPETARNILEHNKIGRKLCKW